MSFPCPHCGKSESFADRTAKDFKPIVPTEIQGRFDEPPPPIPTSKSASNSVMRKQPKSVAFSPYSTTPLKNSPPSTSFPEDPPVSFSPFPTEPAHLEVDFASPAAKATRKAPPIEDRLEKIEISINNLGNEIKSISQAQKTIEMLLKKMWKKEG
ncbi:MAG: hypothetical protein ACFFB3_21335 [Candidatus Hodarchaeota archaeon]